MTATIRFLPTHRHHVCLCAPTKLEDLKDELRDILGPEWDRACVVVEQNEKRRWERTCLTRDYNFRVSTHARRGLEALKDARILFAQLKSVDRWPLLLAEDLRKELVRFDPGQN